MTTITGVRDAPTIISLLRKARFPAFAVDDDGRSILVMPPSHFGSVAENGAAIHKILVDNGYSARLLRSGNVTITKETK